MSKDLISTLSLERDLQIALLTFFPDGEGELIIESNPKISGRALIALDALSSLKILARKEYKSGKVTYRANSGKCGFPRIDLREPCDKEAFELFFAG